MDRAPTLAHLQKQLHDYTAFLFNQGILNDQFTQLQTLEDESNPEFVGEVISLFFQDSERILNELAHSLEQNIVDFKKVDVHVHQLKGSSSSIGAERVQNACIYLRNFCDDKNIEGCLKCLQQVRDEYHLVKGKLQNLLKLEKQIKGGGGSISL